MCPLCAGRRVLRLCSGLPPAGSLLSCRNRLALLQAAHHCSEAEGGSQPPRAPVLPRHRRAWVRSLSPLERISSLMPPELISREVQDLQSDPQLQPPSSTFHGEKDNGGVSNAPQVPSSGGDPDHGGVIRTQQLSSLERHNFHGEIEHGPPGQDQQFRVIAAPQPPSSPGYTSHGGVIGTPQSSSPEGLDFHGELEHGSSGQIKVFDAPKPSSLTPGYISNGESGDGGVIRTSQLSSSFEGHGFHEVLERGSSGQDKGFRVFAAPRPSFPSDHPSSASSAEEDKRFKENMSTPQPLSSLDSGVLTSPQDIGFTEEVTPAQTPSSSPASDAHHFGDSSPSLGRPFIPGDLLLAEYKRRHYSMFKKMFVLKEHGKLVSNWGAIRNQDIVGKLPGQRLSTSTGHEFLLRRPSLEEYVGLMKRGPNIAYPKDITAMMTMMDVSPGDMVLEAGSGSGALSLFLSRAVGADGCIYSFDVRADHHEIAKKNYLIWRKVWQVRTGRCWADNVRFIHKSILDARPDIAAVEFDAVVLDMLHPQLALPVITENLKQGAVCAVYIANITQVIDLLEAIRSRQLPLQCERVMEAGVTNWLVAPARRKDGRALPRADSLASEHPNDEEDSDEEKEEGDEAPAGSEAFRQVPYIARPLPWQTGHTAFLVQLRKFNPAPPTEPEDWS
ncbi:tRNA (adenine(58)-N(1))-methyltransferase, mitochondrial [Gastrophryne carolinensis]